MAGGVVVTAKSTDTGVSAWPVLSGQVGALVALLDAVLVNGGTQIAASITRSGSTATATVTAHGLQNGWYNSMSGATQSEYNIVAQVSNVTSNTFDYTVSGTPATPATGSPLARRAPAGWTKPFTGTNKAAFRPGNVGTNQFYLRVLDDGTTTGGAKEATFRGFETMSDVDTGTNPFPTVAQRTDGNYVEKSATSDATARAWTLEADDGTMLFIPVVNTNVEYLCGFGHFISYKSGDGGNSFCGGCTTVNVVTNAQIAGMALLAGATATAVPTASFHLARSYTQAVGAVAAGSGARVYAAASGLIGASAINGAVTYPNAADGGGLVVDSISVLEFISAFQSTRGRIPGLYAPIHFKPFSNYDVSTGIVGMSGISLMAVNIDSSAIAGQCLIDITGPWW
jgi:hypothetical protein